MTSLRRGRDSSGHYPFYQQNGMKNLKMSAKWRLAMRAWMF